MAAGTSDSSQYTYRPPPRPLPLDCFPLPLSPLPSANQLLAPSPLLLLGHQGLISWQPFPLASAPLRLATTTPTASTTSSPLVAPPANPTTDWSVLGDPQFSSMAYRHVYPLCTGDLSNAASPPDASAAALERWTMRAVCALSTFFFFRKLHIILLSVYILHYVFFGYFLLLQLAGFDVRCYRHS